jgi:hypothetical protein
VPAGGSASTWPGFGNAAQRHPGEDAPTGFDALRTLAVSRIYLDNFDHITAYWVGLGMKAIAFGRVSDVERKCLMPGNRFSLSQREREECGRNAPATVHRYVNLSGRRLLSLKPEETVAGANRD